MEQREFAESRRTSDKASVAILVLVDLVCATCLLWYVYDLARSCYAGLSLSALLSDAGSAAFLAGCVLVFTSIIVEWTRGAKIRTAEYIGGLLVISSIALEIAWLYATHSDPLDLVMFWAPLVVATALFAYEISARKPAGELLRRLLSKHVEG